MKRRLFLATGGAGALGGLFTACGGGSDLELDNAVTTKAHAQAAAAAVPTAAINARVVIVGGGMAGATLAKYLRLWSNGTVAVTLVERETRYTSCIMSSLVLTGQRTISSLYYTYATLKSKYGVTIETGDVVAVDPVSATVRLASGKVLQADRVVLAPGIDFDAVPGLTDSNLMPHAWKAGPQTTLLQQQLSAMAPGGTVVLTIPKAPYRCPPGPYERACLLADWLRVRKPGSKLIVLDGNPDFVTEKDNFSRAFFELHKNIEYHNSVVIHSADGVGRSLQTNLGPLSAQVVNLIPTQKAAPIIFATGLNNSADGRFAAVDVLSYASTAAPRVHVLGDSSATTQPKAGHIANQEAKICADALVRIFGGGQPDPAPVTNSACYSTITMSQASWLTALFQYNATTRTMAPVAAAGGASAGWDKENFDQMNTWFKALMADTFA